MDLPRHGNLLYDIMFMQKKVGGHSAILRMFFVIFGATRREQLSGRWLDEYDKVNHFFSGLQVSPALLAKN